MGCDAAPADEGRHDVPDSQARFEDWRSVGCGVEVLHHLLVRSGIEVTLDEVLHRTLAQDGYDEALGWRHHALVGTAAAFGVPGEVRSGITTRDLDDGVWLVSVNAPEQFDSTHLVAVRRDGERSTDEDNDMPVRIYWPQGHPEHGEVFTVPVTWLAARLTGRGMRFDATVVPTS